METGQQQTISQRVRECMVLADAAITGLEREQYLAEAEGLKQVAAGQPANQTKFTDSARQAAYERGRADGTTLLKLNRGGTP